MHVISLGIALFGVALAVRPLFALDAPHNSYDTSNGYAITCSSCHYDTTTSNTPPWLTAPTTTSTQLDNLCMSCHTAGKFSDTLYADIATHASVNTSTKYGQWYTECRICHNPHYQQQATNYPADPTANVISGTVAALSTFAGAATSTLTVSGVTLIPDDLVNLVLVPNVSYPTRMYRIKANTDTTITVYGALNPNYTAPGKTFGIRYGKLVKDAVATPSGGARQVKFFGNNGPNSFATGTSGSVTGICQVCHTRTTSFNTSGTLEGPGHPSFAAGTDCTQCHMHKTGFKPECGSCHGNPPLVSALGTDGLAINEGGTGSTTPGAHGRHAVSLAHDCMTCHTGGMPASPIYDKKVQIGFNIASGAYQSGAYDGRSQLANGYSYAAGNPGTTITNTGTRTCANIYCHGSTMAPNSGTNITPVWDNPSTATCGACHGATSLNPPVRGSHEMHASETDIYPPAFPPFVKFPRKYTCTVCHADYPSNHVNGRADWAYDVINMPRLAGAKYQGLARGSSPTVPGTYEQCSNLYCHSIVQTSTGGPLTGQPGEFKAPTWGNADTGKCGTCHPVDVAHAVTVSGFPDTTPEMSSGSHARHLAYSFTLPASDFYRCALCHKYDSAGTFGYCHPCHNKQQELHANGKVEVQFEQKFADSSAAYSGTPAPGDGFGSCSNTYCHGNYSGSGLNASPVWGRTASATCGSCHGASSANPPLSGSHVKHVSSTVPNGYLAYGREYRCALCHAEVVNSSGQIIDLTKHVNTVVDWKFDTNDPRVSVLSAYSISPGTAAPSDGSTRAYGSCSKVYCHSNVQPNGGVGEPDIYGTPVWGQGMVCVGCHSSGWDGSVFTVHGEDISSGSHTKHMAYNFGISSGVLRCMVCHNWDGTTRPDCDGCHYTLNEKNHHADGNVDVKFYSGFVGSSAIYNGTPKPGDGYSTCGNTYCHSDGTSVATRTIPSSVSPTWGTPGPLPCNSCHGAGTVYGQPSYPQMTSTTASPKANEHAYHMSDSMFPAPYCQGCHYATTADGTTITNAANHVNGRYDVVVAPGMSYFGTPVSFTYRPDPGGIGGYCDNVTCHSSGPNTAFWGGLSPYITGIVSTQGTACYELKDFNIPAGNFINTAFPITYAWNFGNGDTESGTASSAPVVSTSSHIYASTGPYAVKIEGRDALKRYIYKEQLVYPQQAANIPVQTTSPFKTSVNRWTVTITDESYDPDYNLCGHSGNGGIIISGSSDVATINGKTATSINEPLALTDTPSHMTYIVVYKTTMTPGLRTIYRKVWDNTDTSAFIYDWTTDNIPGPIAIGGTITTSGGGGLGGATVSLKDASTGTLVTSTTTAADGAYSFSGAWTAACFTVTPARTGYTFTPSVSQNICNDTGNVNFTSSP